MPQINMFTRGSANRSNIYFYHPYTIPGNLSNGFIGSGYLSGSVGVINDNTYKFNTAMQSYGGYVLLGLFVYGKNKFFYHGVKRNDFFLINMFLKYFIIFCQNVQIRFNKFFIHIEYII